MQFVNWLLSTGSSAGDPGATVTDIITETTTKATNFERLAGNEPFGERLLYGLKVAAIGMSIVFLVLLILWFIIKVMGYIAEKTGASSRGEEVKKTPSNVSPGAVANFDEASEEETVVALASAAIAAYEEKSQVDFDIKSVTPITMTEDNK